MRNSFRWLAILLSTTLLVQSAISETPRTAWTTSRIQGAPTAPLPYTTERVFGDFQFNHPVAFVSAPDTNSMFLLEQKGKVYELVSHDSRDEPRLVFELQQLVDGVKHVYGIVFHPNFKTNRELFICYVREGDESKGTVVSRFRFKPAKVDEPLEIDPDSEEILYTWLIGGHNGGCLKFGPDGYLYISAGDASPPFPPDIHKVGQDLTSPLATILRIDVDRREKGKPYAIPPDNPFVKTKNALPEIFAYGFRNPWRMAFDRETGHLWVGDVGWELWEMIHFVESGSNHGWSIVEGPNKVNTDWPVGPTPIRPPVASHDHNEARSITGGHVYYGDRLPELNGAYLYGDHVTGRMWKLRRTKDGFEGPTEIARTPIKVICFGLHPSGEVFIVDYLGSIHRFVRNKATQNAEFPRTLSESGLFASVTDHQLATGVLPYEVIAEPWMDGANAKRFVAIPDQQQIGVYKVGSGLANWEGKHRGSWKFPKDSVLGKTIALDQRRIETQLMHFDGDAWRAYTYLWNKDQTEAELAEDKSEVIKINLETEPGAETTKHWLVHNRGDCMICHTNANDMLLGFKPEQLRRPTEEYSDQLKYFAELGLFEQPPKDVQALTDPHDASADLAARARSYLHVNCAHCHRRNGGGSVPMDVLHNIPLAKTNLLDQAPMQGTFGIENVSVIAPGKPLNSVLLYRFSKLGPGHMPKLGGLEVDTAAAVLLHDWIASMGSGSSTTTLDQLKELTKHLGDKDKLVSELSNPTTALAAAHGFAANHIDNPTREKLLQIAPQLPDTSRDLFEPFMDFTERAQRLGNNIDVAQLLAEPGDPERGRQLFLGETLSCKSCHAVQPNGKSTGPNLASLKPDRYERDEILDSILNPSKDIDEAYRTHIIQTADGELLTGIVVEQGDTILIHDAQNKTHTLTTDDIEFRKASDLSLMPDKQLAPLTLRQARDLIEFIHSLNDK